MTLKDISMYGLYKTLLVFNIVLPFLLLPILGIAYLINPEAVHISFGQVHFLGMTITMDIGYMLLYPVIVLLFLINALVMSSIQAYIVKALARYTPIGQIQLSRKLVEYSV